MVSDKIRYFFPKVKYRLLLERKRLWKYCNVERMALRGFKAFPDADAFKKKLEELLGCYDADILVGISEEDRVTILSAADQTLNHIFDYLGSGPVSIHPIDWHTDFKSGKRWNKVWYRNISFIKGADIKVPWELSRCQHLLWLGEAYILTDDDKYAQEIINEINWWIDDNPLMYSVNWTCAMDVAFRAVNWMYSLNMISKYNGFDSQFVEKVSRSLWQHGFFIHKNLEYSIPYSNNHYISDLVGLIYIGELFNDTYKGKKCFKFGLKEFYSEIRRQVLPSGVHYERSVSYHRLMTELLSYPLFMLKRNGEAIPHDIIERIDGMYSYIRAYLKPNGLSPLIGDNDDGRFVPFIKRDFRDHSYLINAGSVENRFVSLGCYPISYHKPSIFEIYSDAGVAIANKNGKYLFVNNGGYSRFYDQKTQIINTHTHNDALSFELSLRGEDIFVDPGTYLYTSSRTDRDAFRSTRKHNTVVVDEEEQNEFIDSFYVRRNILHGSIKYDNSIISCDDKTIAGQVEHNRIFEINEKGLIIKDTIKREGNNHQAVFYFHCGYGIIPEPEGAIIKLCKDVAVSFRPAPATIDIIDDTVSPSYGIIQKTKTLVIKYLFNEELNVVTTIKG